MINETEKYAEVLHTRKPMIYPAVKHDVNLAYVEGTTAYKSDPSDVCYIALKDVPADSGIELTDATYWCAFMRAMPAPKITRHDPNAFYSNGSVVFTSDTIPDVYVARMQVPECENISLHNQLYWKPLAPKAKIENYMVGCAGIVFDHENNILVGERLDYDGEPVDALMGGKPEPDETLAEGLARELHEEIGVQIDPKRFQQLAMREAMASKTQRCITAYFAVKLSKEESGQVKNMEPHKCFKLSFKTKEQVKERGLWQDSLTITLAAHLHASSGMFD